MFAVSISSSEESAGQGGRGAVGSDVQSSSSVSSSFLDKSDEREVDSGPGSPFYGGERVINGTSLFLLKGGVRIDRENVEPSDGWPHIKGYDWASHDVGTFVSDFSTREELQWWADRSHIARDVEDARLIHLGVSHRNERVFHGKGASEEDFFFVYTYMFNQLFLRVSFTAFQAPVLRDLNVAPSQLHPNGWAAIQAFVTVCAAMGITPSVAVFLHYFNVRPLARRGCVSLSSVQSGTLFKPYRESFKNFKKRYFKVIIRDSDRSEFHDEAGLPLFPFYWTRDPRKINARAVGCMTPEELEVVRILNTLPRRLSARNFVECLSHEDFDQITFGMVFSMDLLIVLGEQFQGSRPPDGFIQSRVCVHQDPSGSSPYGISDGGCCTTYYGSRPGALYWDRSDHHGRSFFREEEKIEGRGEILFEEEPSRGKLAAPFSPAFSILSFM
ncbi:hypothetical protein LR48_Vigan06g063100 [Vigna angularis]|uniref:Transposase (putative) gypsy type domain-containing protein n=1 Tax=Phaseolus angularis TaxID=3914 RepID=A0A0L9UR02_PHAAN|nr:hypothetical protein LR48_Vigan06g063100 [Vigna angularis]